MPISIIPNTLFLGISDAIIVGWGIIMTTALLVGNGFTSQLIPEYSNNYMMNLLRNQEPEICAQAETLFSVFRSSSIVQSTQGNHYPNNIIIKRSIIKTLKRLSFKKSRRVFDTFFLEYSLIQECYNNYKEACWLIVIICLW